MDTLTPEIKVKRKAPQKQSLQSETEVKVSAPINNKAGTIHTYQANAFPYKVKIAHLHQAITCAGLVGGEKSINPARPQTSGVQEMTILPQGLLIAGKDKQGRNVATLVPMANVANLILEEI